MDIDDVPWTWFLISGWDNPCILVLVHIALATPTTQAYIIDSKGEELVPGKIKSVLKIVKLYTTK